MNSIEKWIRTDTAHRVPLHESKCRNMHGHSYIWTMEITGELYTTGSQSGMVLDYSFMKELMVKHIDETIDHAIVISTKDEKFFNWAFCENIDGNHPETSLAYKVRKEVDIEGFWSGHTEFGKTYFINDYPTAENLARHFFKILAPRVSDITHRQARLTAMIVNETPTSKATYRL